jgi:hypothetical protein
MKKRLFSLILAALMLFSLFPFTAAAADVVASGSCGENVTWTLDSEGLLTISGSGPMADQNFGGCVVGTDLRDQVRSVVIADGVTYIGNFSFNYNENAETILLPNSVTAFGNNAFDGCKSLQYITLPNGLIQMGNFCFAYCYELQEIEIPEGVTTLGYSVFSNCTSLKRAALPSTLQSVDSVMFANCTALQEIKFTGSQEQWNAISAPVLYGVSNSVQVVIEPSIASGSCGENATWTLDSEGLLTISGSGPMDEFGRHIVDTEFVGESPFWDFRDSVLQVVIAPGVTSVGSFSFYECANLKSVSIPDGVTSIGDGAFWGCSSLQEAAIPDGTAVIGWGVFYECDSLRQINIPESVTEIGKYAFYSCDSLTSAFVPDSVTKIEPYTFAFCENLSEFSLPGSLTSIGEVAFYRCSSLPNVVLPESLTSIGRDAFNQCRSLTDVMLPAGIKAMDYGVFANCTALKRAVILSTDRKLERQTFLNCSALERVYIPETVLYIYGSAFSGCAKLRDVDYGGTVAQWEAIIIDSGNEPLEAAQLHPSGIIGSGVCGENLTWTLDRDGLLVISGEGRMADYMNSASPFANNSVIKNVRIQPGAASIGDRAFVGCHLETISIPEGVTSIGCAAFNGCSSLTDAVLPKSVETIGERAFQNCDSLVEMAIPSGVSRIENYTFQNCSAMKSVTIPYTVTGIGRAAFYGCTSLTDVYYDDSTEHWDAIAIEAQNEPLMNPNFHLSEIKASGSFGENLTWELNENGRLTLRGTGEIPDDPAGGSMVLFPWNKYKSDVKCVVIEKGITQIGDYAFYQFRNLTEVTADEGVARIGTRAFEQCSELKTAQFGAGLTDIGNLAFDMCEKLESMSFPDGLISIGSNAFDTCRKLSNVVLPETLTSIGSYAFDTCGFGIKIIRIPESVTEIGQYVFSNCYGLKTAILPENLSSIRHSMFNNCHALVEIVIPDSVTAIEQWAFSWCTSLTSIAVPSNVEVIESSGFNHCSSLTEIYLPKQLKTIGQGAFSACNALRDVWYSGTEAQWNAILIASGNDPLLGAAIHFTEPALTILTQPQPVTGRVGDTATFFVEAEGEGLTYQWEYQDPGGEWLKSSFKTAAMSCKLTEARNGRQYHCVISDAYEHQVTSDAALITVVLPPVITQQPQNYTGPVGSTAVFSVEAEGEGLTYRWQYRDVGGKWTNSSFRAATMSCKLTAERDGRQYRCVITDAWKNQTTSSAATMTALPGPAITQQPQDFAGRVGTTVTFAVEATGEGLTYRWQYRDVGGKWTNSSFRAASMSCKLTAERDGREYRCIVTDAWNNKVTSEAAAMTIVPPPKITQQPQDFSGPVGSYAVFTVLAEGDGLTYRWQYKDVGGEWLNSSFKTADMSCRITAARDGRQYRCVITDGYGNKITSEAAAIRVTLN